MTPPKKRIAFVQNGLEFQNRDDLNEYEEYYEIFDNGTIEIVPGYTGKRPERGASSRDYILDSAGALGGALGSLGRLLGDQGWRSGDPRTGDPRRGRVTSGRPLSPESKAAINDYLKNAYGLKAPFQESWKFFAQAREIDRSRRSGESFAQAFTEHIGASILEFNTQVQVEVDRRNKATGGAADRPTQIWDTQGPERALDAGDYPDPGVASASSPGDFASSLPENKSSTKTPGSSTGKTPGSSTGPGSALSGGLAGAVDNLPPGPGPGGVEVTPQLLRQFVESDFSLSWNAMINSFRSAGAAGVFMNWLSNQFVVYQREYMGIVGAQALAGKLPVGDFTGFLRRKGMLAGDPTEDLNTVSPIFAASKQANPQANPAAGTTAAPANQEINQAAAPGPDTSFLSSYILGDNSR